MNNLIELQKKLVPDILLTLEKRYGILAEIASNQSIGRRMLATKMGLTERVVRTEIDFFKSEGLIESKTSGMHLTKTGKQVVEGLRDFLVEISGISQIEDTITKRLGIKKTIIALNNEESGDSREELSRLAGKYFISQLPYHKIIGITGGTTMYAFANALTALRDEGQHIVVPARGGLGEEVEIQSNNIAGMLSKKINAHYKLLHLPDNVDATLIPGLSEVPQIRDTLETINNIDLLVFGIGNAAEMAKRRKISPEETEKIIKNGAVSEAFGYYFNVDGEIVYETSTIGIKLSTFKNLKEVIGIAGGRKKAKAILSISKINSNLVLVTDESAARYLMELTGGFNK